MTPYNPLGPDGPTGKTVTAPNGEQLFIYGKSRIKISEHFSQNGKQIDELITGLLQRKLKEKVTEIA